MPDMLSLTLALLLALPVMLPLESIDGLHAPLHVTVAVCDALALLLGDTSMLRLVDALPLRDALLVDVSEELILRLGDGDDDGVRDMDLVAVSERLVDGVPVIDADAEGETGDTVTVGLTVAERVVEFETLGDTGDRVILALQLGERETLGLADVDTPVGDTLRVTDADREGETVTLCV